MKTGKHCKDSLELKKIKKDLEKKQVEIEDIKCQFADILKEIRNLNESNSCGNSNVIRRKISELCTDTRYKLLVDDTKKDTSYIDNETSISRK